MANPRLATATVMAGAALALAVFGMLGEGRITGMSGHAGMAAGHFVMLGASHVPGLIALALSVGAFVVSWGQRSYLVAGLLVAAGVAYTAHLEPFLDDHGVITFLGPVVGLFFGHVMLGLGVAAGIGSARMKIVQTQNKK